jgi:rhamnose utilization protein RhaD (predicted bifunctional aldolase and dehydrogenase)/NAD(P)-dependent dehydrogenase (short-subunit alcohol dehydrogenase family)
MKSLWNDQDAAQCQDDLALRVYTSRLLGGNPSLVLHGGGNTSVKITQTNVFGEPEDLLFVKGSGWDLGTIEAPGFAPVRMRDLLKLAELDSLSDAEMARQLRVATIDPAAPSPSVEAILHAILPFTFVDHTHADAIVTITNTPNGAERIREVFGDTVVIVPYTMPGFVLAKLCHEYWQREAGPQTVGMVLLNHGLFTFGATAREAYENHIALVTKAEEYLAQFPIAPVASVDAPAPAAERRKELAQLRYDISKAAGFPVIVASHDDEQCLNFARRSDLAVIAQQGPATPDHVIRTKRLPMIGRDVAAYVQSYREYFDLHAPNSSQKLTILDQAPRLVIDPELGLCTVGRSAKEAAICEDIYRHTIDIISKSTAMGGYRALPAQDIFDVEYWDLEQAKLKKGGKPPVFAGEVAVVTGAASGIGKASVEAMLARGAAVIALDLNPAITTMFATPNVLGVVCDVSDENAIRNAFEAGVRAFGGIDMLVLNAGIFPSSRKISDMPLGEWERTMQINLNSNVVIMREAYPMLKLSPNGGRVAIIASKNVPAPGPGASAYSASKAALTQLARVAALEWGSDKIRVNVLHPNAVFDTGLWTEEVLANRAASYGLSIEEYKTNNVLRVEVTSKAVADLAAELCGPLFARTTGAQIAVDGGNDRVI